MKTGKEYIDSIKAMNFELYLGGGKISMDDHDHLVKHLDDCPNTDHRLYNLGRNHNKGAA